jgi:hypothetical protein
MLCDTIKEVAKALQYSESSIKHGLNKGYVFTMDEGLRYTVQSWDYDKLKGIK